MPIHLTQRKQDHEDRHEEEHRPHARRGLKEWIGFCSLDPMKTIRPFEGRRRRTREATEAHTENESAPCRLTKKTTDDHARRRLRLHESKTEEEEAIRRHRSLSTRTEQ